MYCTVVKVKWGIRAHTCHLALQLLSQVICPITGNRGPVPLSKQFYMISSLWSYDLLKHWLCFSWKQNKKSNYLRLITKELMNILREKNRKLYHCYSLFLCWCLSFIILGVLHLFLVGLCAILCTKDVNSLSLCCKKCSKSF